MELKKDIENALKEYPGLVMQDRGNTLAVVGNIQLKDPDSGEEIETYSIELHYPERYPYCFPKVKETGGKIQRILDRHVNTALGDTLCLAVPDEEVLLSRNGITTKWFIQNVLLPRLGEEFLVNRNGTYQREYSHGYNGIWEFYFRRFATKDSNLVIALLELLILPLGDQRNLLCSCNSGKKFKKCHMPMIGNICSLPTAFIKNRINVLKENPFTHD